MAYATVEQLAEVLRIRVSPENTERLQRCLDDAALEIDFDLDRLVDDPLPDPAPALIVDVNLSRAVDHYKAQDAVYGALGYEDIGIIRAPKDSFARHAQAITPYKRQWGLA